MWYLPHYGVYHPNKPGKIKMVFNLREEYKEKRFLKFFWWEDCDISKEIIDYGMTAHVLGGSSSPSCSNFALRKKAMDNEEIYRKDVATILKRDFCIDYMLKSFPTAEEAITSIQKVKDLLGSLITFNDKQCLQSTRVGSPIYLKRKTNHSAIVSGEVTV